MQEITDHVYFREAYAAIPARMRVAMTRYILNGVPTGSFLAAVIDNDLQAAVASADEINLPLLALYAKWFRFVAPIECFGSKEKRMLWIKFHEVSQPEDA